MHRALVVGCGSGLEAAILAQKLDIEVVGIDVEEDFNEEAACLTRLQLGDAMAMEFQDDSFDFIYSYHVLEHIPDPRLALQEMSRVLRPGGGYWIGTPNRSRFVGYLGSKTATLRQKVRWNMIDWRARLRGRFRNEYGAHAGFTPAELEGLLSEAFSEVDNVSRDYYRAIYPNRPAILGIINGARLDRFAYPSVYFMGGNAA